MGATVSKSDQTVLVESLTKIVNSVTTTYINKNSNKVSSDQKMYIDMSNSNINCNISATQISDVKFSILSTNKNEATTTMTNDILNQITTALENKNDQSISGLNLGQAALSMQNQNIKQQIQTCITNSINSSIVNIFENTAGSGQGMYIKLVGSNIFGETCDFKQSNLIQMFSEQTANNMVQNAVDNGLVTVVDTQAVAENKQSLTGVSLLGLIGGGAFGLIGLLIIIYIIYTVVKKKQDKS
jgi:hypothetical protein